jgi:hypothetical protein
VNSAKQYFARFLQDPSDPFSAASCLDIMAVTVPTAGNNYTAVSLYRFGGDSTVALINERAMALVQACGHAIASPILGHVFVGRARDDESADVWERLDFTIDDADPKAAWCQTARQTGGGGGSGKAAAASLSGIMQSQAVGSSNLQLMSGDAGNSSSATATTTAYGMHGSPAVQDKGYTWTQDGDEIELKFAVPLHTVPKDCKLHFGRTSLKVTVAGKELLQGATFLPIVADECTYTLTQEAGSDTKDLTVTLMKEETAKTWTFVVQ